MRCLHCGKKLSLLRKFAGGQFCSDGHRQAYQRQQDDLALARLIESQTRIVQPKAMAAPPPARTKKKKGEEEEALPPWGGLLPEPLPTARWKRICCPPLALAPLGPVRCTPESPLRISIRGFVRGEAAPLLAPSGCRQQVWAAPAPAADFAGVLASGPALGAWAGRLEVAGDGAEAPPPALIGALCPLPAPAPAGGALRPPRALFAKAGRKKLVVITPPAAQRPAAAALHAARPAPLSLPAVAAGPGWASRVLHPPVWRVAPALPAAGLALLPPSPCDPGLAEAASGGAQPALPETSEPPQAGLLLALGNAALLPAGGQAVPGQCRLDCLAPHSDPHLPVHSLQSNARLPVPGSCALPARLAGGPAPRRRTTAGPEQLWAAAEPCRPRLRQGGPVRTPSLPGGQDPLPVLTRALPAAGAVRCSPTESFACGVPAAPLSPAIPAAVLVHSAQAPLAVPGAVPPGAQEVAGASLRPCWADSSGAIPAAPLRLSVPEPAPVISCRHVQETTEQEEPAGGEARSGLADGAVAAPPTAAQEPDLAALPALWGRVPTLPLRPADCTLPPATEAGEMTCCLWGALAEQLPLMPALRFTVDHADGSGARREAQVPPAPLRRRPFRLPVPTARRFWSHAPADLKWVALALPLLLVLVVYSFRADKPNKEVAAQDVAQTTSINGKTVLGGQLNALQRVILSRAAVHLYDDFRNGLGAWQGKEGWSKTWKYGDATFLEPGQLALYGPSVGMTDYTLQFLGQVERRSLNWVFRARDVDNYYSMRIAITRSAPLPEAQVVRSVVIDGKERDVKTLPIPFPVRIDTLYLVRMEVQGQDFTTYIQGQIVDHFSDSRLSQGGVGFYSPKGDKSLLRWVEVSHQYDYLGRLCALLSPYSMQGMVRGMN